jgi:hypothetical protein
MRSYGEHSTGRELELFGTATIKIRTMSSVPAVVRRRLVPSLCHLHVITPFPVRFVCNATPPNDLHACQSFQFWPGDTKCWWYHWLRSLMSVPAGGIY